MMGGSNESVMANLSMMTQSGADAFTTDLKMLTKETSDAFKNIKNGAVRAATLDKIKEEEIKIYERFVGTLNNVIESMLQLPSIMIN